MSQGKVYGFREMLSFSRGVSQSTHPDTIKSLLVGCVKVEEPSVELNKAGIDYVATLRRGATVNLDMKARTKGCSKYWKQKARDLLIKSASALEPELSLEIWNVLPEGGRQGKAGWTLDESKLTDYTVHVFDPSDTKEVFLLPFQLLRMAFSRNCKKWREKYRTEIQNSGGWKSQCVFVPADVVLEAIQEEMRRSELGEQTLGPPEQPEFVYGVDEDELIEPTTKRSGGTPLLPGFE